MNIESYIENAIQEGKSITIKYIKYNGEISIRTISDLRYSEEFGSDYIEGYCHLRQEKRTFKISRIREVDGISSSMPSVSFGKTKTAYNPHTSTKQTQSTHPSPSGSISNDRPTSTSFNVKQNSTAAWLSSEAIRAASGEEITLESLRGCYCVMGIDLSQAIDLTAVSLVVRKNGKDYIYTHFWLPSSQLEKATARDELPYREYIKRGLVTLCGESYVDYEEVIAWIDNLVTEYEILPLKIGYDRYSAQMFIKTLQKMGFHCDDVFQGYNLTGMIYELEAGLKDGNFLIGDNDLLKVHLLNTALYSDGESRRVKIVKISDFAHIDGVASILDALAVRGKYFDEIGEQLENED